MFLNSFSNFDNFSLTSTTRFVYFAKGETSSRKITPKLISGERQYYNMDRGGDNVDNKNDKSKNKPTNNINPEVKQKIVEKKNKNLEKTKKPVHKKLKKLETRVNRSKIFESEKRKEECIKTISDALEKFSPDKWRKFVVDHQKYSGGFRQWNTDLCTFLGKAKLSAKQERQYACGLQMCLARKFAKKGFFVELDKKDKKTNGFTYTEGFLGPYTISVLAGFLNSDLYAKKDPNKEWKDLSFAKLDKTHAYGKKTSRQNEFNEAIAHLKEGLGMKKEKEDGTKDNIDEENPTPENKVKPESVQLLSKLSEKEKEQVVKLTGAVCTYGAFKLKKFKKLNKKQKKDFEAVAKVMDPAAPWFPAFDNIKDSWPDQAFSEYKKAYDNVDEDETRVGNEHARLSNAIDDYLKQSEAVVEKLERKYEPKVSKLVIDYSLPNSLDITDLSPVKKEATTNWNSGADERRVPNAQYTEQKGKIFKKRLQTPEGRNIFFDGYFAEKSCPKKIFNKKTTEENWKDLKKFLDPKKSEEQFKQYFTGRDKEDQIIGEINETICLNNMYIVNDEYQKLQKNFNTDLDSALGTLDKNYGKYYGEYKGKKGKDFVADILDGKIKA